MPSGGSPRSPRWPASTPTIWWSTSSAPTRPSRSTTSGPGGRRPDRRALRSRVHPTATRSPAPCGWPRTGTAWPSCATPTWPSSRTPGTGRPRRCHRRQTGRRTRSPPRGGPVDIFDAAGLDRPAARHPPLGARTADGEREQQRRACTSSPGPSCPRGLGLGPLGPVAPRPGRAAGNVDGLPRPGGHGPRAGGRAARVEALDVRWNTPDPRSHPDPARRAAPARHPLPPAGGPDRPDPAHRPGSIDGQMEAANDAIDSLWPDGLPRSTYQEWLSLGGPAPTASGTGASPPTTHLLGRGRRILAKGRRGRR